MLIVTSSADSFPHRTCRQTGYCVDILFLVAASLPAPCFAVLSWLFALLGRTAGGVGGSLAVGPLGRFSDLVNGVDS